MIAIDIFIFMNFLIEEVADFSCNIIYIIIVIAVFGSSLHFCTEFIIAFPVIVDGIDDFCHGNRFFFKYQLFDGCQRVCHNGNTDTCDNGTDIIFCAAFCQVFAVLHAVLNTCGHERSGNHFHMEALGCNQADNSLFDEISKLFIESFFHFFICRECFRVFFIQGDFLAAKTAFAFVCGKFQSCRKIQVRCGSPFPCFTEMRYHTATVRPVASVFRFITCVYQHLIACVIAVDCREASAFAYQMCHSRHKIIRGIRMDTYAQAGLMCQCIFCCFQAHVRQLIGSIFPISGSAAYCQVLELVITSEEISCVRRNCPNPFRKFQPQAFDQFLCFIRCDDTSFFICFIIRIHILVETSGVPCQRVFGQNAAQLCEPHELHRFTERFGRIFRNYITDFRNLQQFCFSGFVSFFCCHFSCFFRITVCQTDDTITYQHDGTIEFHLFRTFQRCSV